jgi:RNA polymerase sigma-70 factor (ECF subfamily)
MRLIDTVAFARGSRRDRNQALSYKCDRKSDSHAGVTDSQSGGGTLHPEKIADNNGQLLRLATAIAQLPDEQRTVLEMKLLFGLSLEEISEETNRSKESVVGLLFRAVKQLRLSMQEWNPGTHAVDG